MMLFDRITFGTLALLLIRIYTLLKRRVWIADAPDRNSRVLIPQSIIFGVEIEDRYIDRFEVKVVGSSEVHQELWIPATDLAEFNRYIIGKIKIVAAYYGDRFKLKIDPATNLPLTISQS
jgi:hypothetical protein